MSWRTITADDVQAEILPDEVTAVTTVQGANTLLPGIVTNLIGKFRAAIQVGGNNLDAAGTIPDQLREEFIAMARWKWFSSLPNTDLLSDARKAQYSDAQSMLEKISKGEIKVEFPAAITGGPAGQMQVASTGHRRPTKGLGGIL